MIYFLTNLHMLDGRCKKAIPYALCKMHWMEKIGHETVYLEKSKQNNCMNFPSEQANYI